jgi:hypothetical protein
MACNLVGRAAPIPVVAAIDYVPPPLLILGPEPIKEQPAPGQSGAFHSALSSLQIPVASRLNQLLPHLRHSSSWMRRS